MRVRACIYAAAFLSGASVMSLEMAAFRLVQPAFGSDLIVWGSLISVFLGGLAAGAWAGGRLADARPTLRKLALLLALAGATAMTIPLYSDAVLDWTFPDAAEAQPVAWPGDDATPPLRVYTLPDLRWPALAAGALLFALPAFLLGTASPYAVKLLIRALPRLGAGVGAVSAVSTAGAILGTLGTAFYLVAWMSTPALFAANGAVLLGLAALLALAGRHASQSARNCV